MLTDMPALNHQQQQEAVERIQALMAQGMSSGEAIRLVANEIRASHSGDRVSIRFDDEQETPSEESPRDDEEDESDGDGYR